MWQLAVVHGPKIPPLDHALTMGITYKVNRDRVSGLLPALPRAGKDDSRDSIPWALMLAFDVQELHLGGRGAVRGSLL